MFILAIATSIDALAVGVTFAFLDYPIVEAITIIGVTTFGKSGKPSEILKEFKLDSKGIAARIKKFLKIK